MSLLDIILEIRAKRLERIHQKLLKSRETSVDLSEPLLDNVLKSEEEEESPSGRDGVGVEEKEEGEEEDCVIIPNEEEKKEISKPIEEVQVKTKLVIIEEYLNDFE